MTLNWEQYQTWLASQWLHQDALPAHCPHPHNIYTDSRQAAKNKFFVPIVGEFFDGHKFIPQVMQNGAQGFFYELAKKNLIPTDLLPFGVAVKDSLTSLQAIARGWLSHLKPQNTVVIVGSVGKTTVKEMCAAIFTDAHITHGSFNNEIGVPLTLLKLDASHKNLVLEFGARHLGDIKFLCEIATPNIAVLLNVYGVHIAEFGSFERLIQTKTEVFRHCTEDATLITFADNQILVDAAAGTFKKTFHFGSNQQADVRVQSHQYRDDGGMSIHLQANADALEINLPSCHDSYPINVAAATAIALTAGITPENITSGLKKFSPADGRFQIHQTTSQIIVDDSYNASPTSMAAGFKSCAQQFSQKKTLVVLGDMLELGEDSALLHRQTGSACWTTLRPNKMITVGSLSIDIVKGATEAGMPCHDTGHFDNVDKLLATGLQQFSDFEVIYLKASNSLGFSKLSKKLQAI